MDFLNSLKAAVVGLGILLFAVMVYEVLFVSDSTEGYNFMQADEGSRLEREMIKEQEAERGFGEGEETVSK